MKLAISTSFFASVLGQAPGGAAQYLYCINANNHGSNPRMLPNNMCCPFYEQAGIKGKPYHSAVHGCCGTALYDLTTQDCCPEAEVIMEKGTRPSSPTGFFGSAQDIGGEPTILLMWDEAVSGSSYYLDVKSMKLNGKEVEIEKPFGIGAVDSHFASLSGIQSGVEYEFEVSTINCLGDISSSSKFSVTA